MFLCCCLHCSISKSCLVLCDSMNCSKPGSSVLHYIPEFAQTHIHWVSDAIKPSHPLLPPSSSCLRSFSASGSFSISRLFASGGQSTGVSASALLMNIQGWLPLGWLVWSPCSSKDFEESSPASQFKSISSLALKLLLRSNCQHPHMTTGKP